MALPNLKLRPVAETDAGAIRKVVVDGCADPAVALWVDVRWRSVDALVASVCKGFTWVLVAEQQGDVVGFVACGQDEAIGVVSAVMVRPDRQRWGVGKLLMEAIISRLYEAGVRFMEATIPEDVSGGCALFRCFQFREVSRSVCLSNSAGSGVVVLEESDGVVRNYLESEYCKKGLWVHFERRWRY